MAANNVIKLSEINYDDIKSNLRDFLSNQSELQDYDYSASSMQTLLSLLAYNTYTNNFYLNMVGNEMFLDSAQIRNNIVSRAKMLGYTPRSARGAIANIQLVLTPTGSPNSITIPRNLTFKTTIDEVTYTYVTTEQKIVNTNASGVYSTNITLKEGDPLTHTFVVDSSNPVKFIVPNSNADTTSFKVDIITSSSNSSSRTFTEASSLASITANSFVYFLEESNDGKYELLFGNDVLGKKLDDGNIVSIQYNTCNGELTNGANNFTLTGSISGVTSTTINLIDRSSGGGDKETDESIKFNAPKSYSAQDRAITANDYRSIILSNFSDIQSVSVWGGEENSPRTFGKVYVSIKPRSGTTASDTRKTEIKNFLKARNSLTIEPEIVDPTYVYVRPEINVKYNPNATTLSPSQVLNNVTNKLLAFETNKLGLFAREFYGSEMIDDLRDAEGSILSVSVDIKLEKRFEPLRNQTKTYTLNFNKRLIDIHQGSVLTINETLVPGRGVALYSSSFTYEGKTSFFDDDGFGNIRVYNLQGTAESAGRVYSNRNAGTIDYTTGLVKININIEDFTNNVGIYVVPADQDIKPLRNQIMLIAGSSVFVYNNNTQQLAASTNTIDTAGVTTTIAESGILTVVY